MAPSFQVSLFLQREVNLSQGHPDIAWNSSPGRGKIQLPPEPSPGKNQGILMGSELNRRRAAGI